MTTLTILRDAIPELPCFECVPFAERRIDLSYGICASHGLDWLLRAAGLFEAAK